MAGFYQSVLFVILVIAPRLRKKKQQDDFRKDLLFPCLPEPCRGDGYLPDPFIVAMVARKARLRLSGTGRKCGLLCVFLKHKLKPGAISPQKITISV